MLLRMEAVASSKIEGVVMGGGRILRAEAATLAGERGHDATASEILGNIRAMRTAIERATNSSSMTIDDICEIHAELLAGTDRASIGGVIRTQQNWIGGSDYNPCGADYVPPPAEAVRPLLENLCDFASSDSLPPLAQAALVHAQFETIHPFGDGNGRTGRALIHVVLRRRALASRIVVPVSLVLATWSERYVGGLVRFRYTGQPGTPESDEAINQWLETFAVACRRAVDDAESYERRITEIEAAWRSQLGNIRANSAIDRLISALPGSPVVTVNTASKLISRSFPATNDAIERLAGAGVLSQIRIGRRNRAYEAGALVAAFTELERRLASVPGDTREGLPNRGAPAHNL